MNVDGICKAEYNSTGYFKLEFSSKRFLAELIQIMNGEDNDFSGHFGKQKCKPKVNQTEEIEKRFQKTVS